MATAKKSVTKPVTSKQTATGKVVTTPAAAAKKAGMKGAAKQVVEAVAAPEPKATKEPGLPAVYRDGTHSAIVFEIGAKAVTLITMASMKLEEMRRAEFDSAFSAYPEYPVRRCAEVYLGSSQYRAIDEQTQERLLAITGGKMPVSAKTFQQQQAKENEMPKTVTKGAKSPAHPLRRASDANLRQALSAAGVKAPSESPSAAKGGDKPTTVKAPAAKTVPAKKAAAPAKSTEKPTAKAAPAAKTAAKTAPAKAEKAGAAVAGGRAPKFDEATKVKMGDTAKAKRGKMLTFIEAAIELAKKGKGVTSRGAIEAKVKDAWDGDDLNTYFPYAVKNGLLVVA